MENGFPEIDRERHDFTLEFHRTHCMHNLYNLICTQPGWALKRRSGWAFDRETPLGYRSNINMWAGSFIFSYMSWAFIS